MEKDKIVLKMKTDKLIVESEETMKKKSYQVNVSSKMSEQKSHHRFLGNDVFTSSNHFFDESYNLSSASEGDFGGKALEVISKMKK